MRLEFYFWNREQFHQPDFGPILVAFFQGLRFDSVTIGLLSLPLFLFSWLHYLFQPRDSKIVCKIGAVLTVLSLALNFFVMCLSLVDNELVNFTGKRFTFDTLFLLREIGGKMDNFIASYWQLWIINPILVFSFIYFSWRTLVRRKDSALGPRPGIFMRIVLGFVALSAFVIVARGGTQMKPLSFVDSRIFEVPLMNQMVTNTGFPLLKSMGHKKLPRWKFFSHEEELARALEGMPIEPGDLLKKPEINIQSVNVVFVILESFSLEYMGLDGRKSYTPYFDSLAKKGLFFKNGFANGRRSIEGVGAILAGIPAWMDEPFISSEFATNQYLGVGTWFKNRGYQTSFFHGGKNGTMYFDSFTRAVGFDEYYGFNEYPNKADFDGTWGIFDEPFLQFMVEKLNQAKTPFASAVFTLSSHQPYRIPDHFRNRFTGGPIEILKSVQYADHALQKFFESAEQQSWFDNTVFVLVADHTGRPYLRNFDHEIGSYQIPILFYAPRLIKSPLISEKILSQIDIFPTLQDLFGQKPSPFLLGQSAFSKGHHPAIVWTEDRYIAIDKALAYTWSPNQSGQLHERKDDGLGPHFKAPQEKAFEDYLKASLHRFSQGLYDNKLYYPDRK